VRDDPTQVTQELDIRVADGGAAADGFFQRGGIGVPQVFEQVEQVYPGLAHAGIRW
jgi:hypothetical protein